MVTWKNGKASYILHQLEYFFSRWVGCQFLGLPKALKALIKLYNIEFIKFVDTSFGLALQF